MMYGMYLNPYTESTLFQREEEERRIMFQLECQRQEEKPYRGYGARKPVIHKRKPVKDTPKLLDGLVSRIQTK